MPKTWKYKKPLPKEQLISKFEELYYKFAKELKADSPRVLNLPKPVITSILKGELGDKYKQYYKRNSIRLLLKLFIESGSNSLE